MPKPYKGKGKRNGTGKGGKGDKGKGKGQLHGLGGYQPWSPPLGHMPFWEDVCYVSGLVPLCATMRHATDKDKKDWQRKELGL